MNKRQRKKLIKEWFETRRALSRGVADRAHLLGLFANEVRQRISNQVIDQLKWLEKRKNDPAVDRDDPESIAWMRSRPQVIKDLMVRLPPSCFVMAKAGLNLRCPAPGAIGRISSYVEPSPDNPEGLVTVVQEMPVPQTPMRAQCQLDWLTVVAYNSGMTPQWVREVLNQ